eukprot:GILI01009513.1.p1 GENE.GILI01009513.1~~GILI01009513.1.p1  ORF type:complete len:669 (+),score=107.90 GILI01009513.1:29-2008(+)
METLPLQPQEQDKQMSKDYPRTSNRQLVMEDVFEQFMRSERGLATGHCTLNQAIDVWSATCQMAEEAILKRQSLVIPGFANVGVAKETEHMGGIWRSRLSFVPCVALAPAFISQYCSDRSGYHVANPQKYGGAVPVLMNGATLSSYSNVPRHVAVHILRDLIRIIGKLLLDGHPVTGRKVPLLIELGFATLDFAPLVMNVKWSRSFLDELATSIKQADSDGKLGNTTGSTSPRRPATAAARVPAPPTPRARVVPAPPSVQPQGKNSSANRPATARLAATPSLPNATPSPSRPQSSRASRAATPSEAAAPGTPRAISQAGFTDSSPRNREAFETALNAITNAKLNPYLKSKARKAFYRKQRGTAFEESWGAQLQLQKEKEAKERDEERERVEYFRRALAEQAAKEHNTKINRRDENRQIQEINKALIVKRDELALPRHAQDPGDLFNSRFPPARPPSNDQQILRHQMAEKKEKEAREQAADRAYHLHLAQQDEAWNRNILAEKKHKLGVQKALMGEYELQLKLKQEEKDRYKATMPKSGCILYGEEQSAEDERNERLAVKMRTRDFQTENRRHVEEKEYNERIATAEKDIFNRHFRLEQSQLAQQQSQDELKSIRSRQKELGETLKRQMNDKKLNLQKEKLDRDTWKEFNYLKNESSDDD